MNALLRNLHPVFADALAPLLPVPEPRIVLVGALREACEAIELCARHAFVVCGQPDTQEELERAWECEDADSYAQWRRLCATVRQYEGEPFATTPMQQARIEAQRRAIFGDER